MLHLDMAISILVMTPDQGFGEFIQQALQEINHYRVTTAHNDEETIEYIQSGVFQIVVIDLDLILNPSELISSLLEEDQNLRIIAMKEGVGFGSAIREMEQVKSLEGAFQLPNLIKALEGFTQEIARQDSDAEVYEPKHSIIYPSLIVQANEYGISRQAPEWLQDVHRAAQHLSRLSIEYSAQAALISKNFHLWAYAGELSKPAAEELALSVWNYWANDGGIDFARYIRLEANQSEYMLYATGLGDDYVLALAFELEVPFSVIRSQAGELAKRLSSPLPDLKSMELVDDTKMDGPVGGSEISKDHVLIDDTNITLDSPVESIQPGFHPDSYDLDDDDVMPGFIEDLLSSVDMPDPDGLEEQDMISYENLIDLSRPAYDSEIIDEFGFQNDKHPDFEQEQFETPFDTTQQGEYIGELEEREEVEGFLVPSFEVNLEHSIPNDYSHLGLNIEKSYDAVGDRDMDDLHNRSASYPNLKNLQEPNPYNVKGSQPSNFERSGGQIRTEKIKSEDLEPVNPALHNLSYSCVLVPRMPNHHLVGELATLLNKRIQKLCLAFDWRLEHLSIRPGYLHWVVVVQPEITPAVMIQDMGAQISKHIFSEFPRLTRDNPSGDFWATGYLIVNGRDPLSHQLVDEYLKRTRLRQGSSRSRTNS